MEKIVLVTSISVNALFLYRGRTLSVNSKALPTLVEDMIVAFAEKPYLLQYHLNTSTCSQAADGKQQMGCLEIIQYQVLVPSSTLSSYVAFVING